MIKKVKVHTKEINQHDPQWQDHYLLPEGLIPESEEHLYHVIEGQHQDAVPKLVHAKQLHPSVFEADADHDAHPDLSFQKAVFSWIAADYHVYYRSTRWWLTAGIIFVLAVILEAISGNWTMLAATVVYGFVYWFNHLHQPQKHYKVILSHSGVKIGHKQIPYSQIEHFGIIYDPPFVKRLHFQLKNKLSVDLVVEMEHQNPQELRNFLRHYLPEHEGIKEHLTDIFLRIIKL